MKINANKIRVGHILDLEGHLTLVTSIQHTQPGKGGAYVQVEMKDLAQGTKKNHRFRSSETVDKAFLEEKTLQYLYAEGSDYICMDEESFEQHTISQSLLGDSHIYLEPSMKLKASMYDDIFIQVRPPEELAVVIDKTEPFIKGQTATQSYKGAWLKNGHKIMVPPHINEGDEIIINTETHEYMKRSTS